MEIRINGKEITDAAVEAEMVHHVQADRPFDDALRALAIRQIVLDEAAAQGIDVSGVVRNAATSVPIFQMIYLNWTDIDRTPIIEFDFHYVPLNSGNKVWPNRCDVFEKETTGQKIAYSGSEFLKSGKRGRQASPGPL